MSGNHRSTAIALLLVCCLMCSPAAAFNVYKVDPDCVAFGAYATIQAAINDAAANPGADYVWISNDNATRTYSGQHIFVNDPDGVIIEGGFSDCNDFDPATDLTTVSGSGNDGGPVFEITGNSNVYLGNLMIAYAQRDNNASGGGISFVGTGELDIAATSVILNNAGYGAGINVTATGGPNSAVLNLLHDVFVFSNTAGVSGGGIRVESGARLIAAGPNTTIKGNHALGGYGGGIEILGPARADIGSPGYYPLGGVVNNNDADYGGGIAVLDNGNGEAVLRTFAYDNSHPATLNDNVARYYGGGIYLGGLADACLISPNLVGNIAEDGAAIYYSDYVADGSGNYTSEGGIYINGGWPDARVGTNCGPEAVSDPPLYGTSSCYAGGCNTFSGHTTQHADFTPSSGSVIFLFTNELRATRIRIEDSIAGRIFQSIHAGSSTFSRCLVTDNAVSDDLISISFGTAWASCTIANNYIGGGHIFNVGDGRVDLADDIFDQPGQPTVTFANGEFTVIYSMAANPTGLPTSTNPGVIAGLPSFVDAAHGDYHLRATSLGVDFAPTTGGIDLDGAPGTFNLPQIANKFGPADLGAYELQTAFTCDSHADAVFCDGFGP